MHQDPSQEAIAQLRDAFFPKSLLAILGRDTLKTLLTGFCHELKSGAALLYAQLEGDALVVGESDRIDAVNGQSLKEAGFFNPICRLYRNAGGESDCRCCDLQKAREIVARGHGRGHAAPEEYECHLGMDDLAYPVFCGDRCYAVVFAGQLIPEEERRRIKILERIPLQNAPDFNREISGGLWSTAKQLEDRKRRLQNVCRLLQAIVDEIYGARIRAAEEAYIQHVSEALAAADLSEPSRWWGQIAPLLCSFQALMGLRDFRVFLQYTTYYKQEYPLTPGAEAQQPRIPTKDVVVAVGPDQIVEANRNERTRQLAEQTGSTAATAHFHLSSTRAGERHLSTLVAFEGGIPDLYGAVAARFFRTLGLRSEIASLVFALRDAYANYLNSVADTAHDVRTPLQALVLHSESLASLPAIIQPGDQARFQELAQRVDGINLLIESLQAKTRQMRKDVDLLQIVQRAIDTVRPVATNHPCRLEFAYLGPDPALPVRCDPVKVQRALQNLLDNAIKYSWHGDFVVRVGVRVHEERYARVSISNYGIGIPPEFLKDFHERGRRALINDRRYERRGSGRGLPSSFDILKDHAGWFEISSKAADTAPRKPGEEFHRFVTTVDAYLPLT